MNWKDIFQKKGVVGGMDDDELAGLVGSNPDAAPGKPSPTDNQPNDLHHRPVEEYEEDN